jgi:hypothetical protein
VDVGVDPDARSMPSRGMTEPAGRRRSGRLQGEKRYGGGKGVSGDTAYEQEVSKRLTRAGSSCNTGFIGAITSNTAQAAGP